MDIRTETVYGVKTFSSQKNFDLHYPDTINPYAVTFFCLATGILATFFPFQTIAVLMLLLTVVA